MGVDDGIEIKHEDMNVRRYFSSETLCVTKAQTNRSLSACIKEIVSWFGAHLSYDIDHLILLGINQSEVSR